MFVSQDNHKTTLDIEENFSQSHYDVEYVHFWFSNIQTKLLIVSINVDIVILSENQHVNSTNKSMEKFSTH